ncbi:hypothetical protein OQA88_4794 [Cercophora sp. LCS_1]
MSLLSSLAANWREQRQEDKDEESLVIGIDFGTTQALFLSFGVLYPLTRDSSFSGVAWATAADMSQGKINIIKTWPGGFPRQVKAPTELYYENGQIKWGFKVPHDCDPILWFKLLLLKDKDLGEDLRCSDITIQARRLMKQVDKTAEELVTDYLRLLWEWTLKSIRESQGESNVNAVQLHVMLTALAIWKDYARASMAKAAHAAGILENRPVGQTTHSFAPEPEAAALSTLGEPNHHVKKGDVYIICVTPAAGRENIKGIFAESLRGINAMVDGQIKKAREKRLPVTGIVLVGGVGYNLYLHGHRKNRYSAFGIDILHLGGEKPRTAIAKGADGPDDLQLSTALAGLSIKIDSAISRLNIGVKCRRKFIPGKHLEQDKFWSAAEGHYRAKNQGDSVSYSTSVSHDFYKLLNRSGEKVKATLYSCEDDVPLNRYEPHLSGLCNITFKVDNYKQLKTHYHATTGAEMKRLDYEIVLKPSEASSELTVLVDGKKLGGANVEIKYS